MKKIFWIIVVIALIVVGYWFWESRQGPGTGGLPRLPEVSDDDTTVQIQQDLDRINLGDINAEFESIDADLNNL